MGGKFTHLERGFLWSVDFLTIESALDSHTTDGDEQVQQPMNVLGLSHQVSKSYWQGRGSGWSYADKPVARTEVRLFEVVKSRNSLADETLASPAMAVTSCLYCDEALSKSWRICCNPTKPAGSSLSRWHWILTLQNHQKRSWRGETSAK